MTDEYIEPLDIASDEPVEPVDSGTTELEGQDDHREASPDAEEVKPSRGVQKRIDELVRQREEWKRQAESWQQVASQGQTGLKPDRPAYPADSPKPTSDKFDTYDDFVEALADWKAEQKTKAFQVEQVQRSKQARLTDFHSQAQAKYQNWNEVFNGSVPISDTMADVILESKSGPDLGYYLGENVQEARRIFNLPAHVQAYELGKIEMKLASKPVPPKSETNAPRPTAPVGTRDIPPKSLENMSNEEYVAYREKALGYR